MQLTCLRKFMIGEITPSSWSYFTCFLLHRTNLAGVAAYLNMSCKPNCRLDRFTKNFFWKFKKWIVNSMEDYQTKHVRIFFWSQMSLLHKVLDPPSYTRDLQRAKFQKSILGHNFWMECPTDLNSTPLSYIFNALFRDIPLAYLTQHLTRDICDACDVTYVTYVTHVT